MDFAITERPKSLEDFKGNSPTVGLLKGMFEKNTLPHTLMIVGAAGCGKTSLAGIIKDYLKVSDSNYKEYDIGKVNDIESIRKITDEASQGSLLPGNRIYFLDECHKLKNLTANAMLKGIETPRNDVYFIFATTEESVVRSFGDAFWSRMTVLRLKPLSGKEIAWDILKPVCDKYKITISKSVAKSIIDNSYGCPRSALKLLYMVKDLDETQALSLLESGEECGTTNMFLPKELIYPTRELDFEFIKEISEYVKMNGSPEALRNSVLSYCDKVFSNPRDENSLMRAYKYSEVFKEPTYSVGEFMKRIYMCYLERA